MTEETPWYDFSAKTEKTEKTNEYHKQIKYDKIIYQKTKNLIDVIGQDLKPNTQYRIVTERAINAIVVLDYILQKYEIQEIFIAIYRMNESAVNRIKQVIDEGQISCSILISSFFRENKKYESWAKNLIAYAENRKNVKVSFAVNHAKVFLAKTKDDKFIVFEGSGNLSDNARIEQYLIEDNEESFNFHKNWIKEYIK